MLKYLIITAFAIAIAFVVAMAAANWYHRSKRERMEREESQKKSKVMVSADGIDWAEAQP